MDQESFNYLAAVRYEQGGGISPSEVAAYAKWLAAAPPVTYGIPAAAPAAPAPATAEDALIALEGALRTARRAGVTGVGGYDLADLQDEIQDALDEGRAYREAKCR